MNVEWQVDSSTVIFSVVCQTWDENSQDGRLSPKSIYDIIAHAKFANDLNEKMGQRMWLAQRLAVRQCLRTSRTSRTSTN